MPLFAVLQYRFEHAVAAKSQPQSALHIAQRTTPKFFEADNDNEAAVVVPGPVVTSRAILKNWITVAENTPHGRKTYQGYVEELDAKASRYLVQWLSGHLEHVQLHKDTFKVIGKPSDHSRQFYELSKQQATTKAGGASKAGGALKAASSAPKAGGTKGGGTKPKPAAARPTKPSRAAALDGYGKQKMSKSTPKLAGEEAGGQTGNVAGTENQPQQPLGRSAPSGWNLPPGDVLSNAANTAWMQPPAPQKPQQLQPPQQQLPQQQEQVVTVLFEEPRELGLVFSKDFNDDKAKLVTMVKPGSQASLKHNLQLVFNDQGFSRYPGMNLSLTKVNDVSVVDLDCSPALKMIQQAGRPLLLEFSFHGILHDEPAAGAEPASQTPFDPHARLDAWYRNVFSQEGGRGPRKVDRKTRNSLALNLQMPVADVSAWLDALENSHAAAGKVAGRAGGQSEMEQMQATAQELYIQQELQRRQQVQTQQIEQMRSLHQVQRTQLQQPRWPAVPQEGLEQQLQEQQEQQEQQQEQQTHLLQQHERASVAMEASIRKEQEISSALQYVTKEQEIAAKLQHQQARKKAAGKRYYEQRKAKNDASKRKAPQSAAAGTVGSQAKRPRSMNPNNKFCVDCKAVFKSYGPSGKWCGVCAMKHGSGALGVLNPSMQDRGGHKGGNKPASAVHCAVVDMSNVVDLTLSDEGADGGDMSAEQHAAVKKAAAVARRKQASKAKKALAQQQVAAERAMARAAAGPMMVPSEQRLPNAPFPAGQIVVCPHCTEHMQAPSEAHILACHSCGSRIFSGSDAAQQAKVRLEAQAPPPVILRRQAVPGGPWSNDSSGGGTVQLTRKQKAPPRKAPSRGPSRQTIPSHSENIQATKQATKLAAAKKEEEKKLQERRSKLAMQRLQASVAQAKPQFSSNLLKLQRRQMAALQIGPAATAGET